MNSPTTHGLLQGRVAVITGGASGIGEAAARRFAAEGARVVIADVDTPRGEAVAREIGQALFVRTDVTSEVQVQDAISRALSSFGCIDVMVNNAGIVGAIGPVSTTPTEDWRATFAVLVDSVFFGMKHAAPHMIERKRGVILSLSSVAGLMGGLGPHAYTAAKHAVLGLTKSVASELAPFGVRVNAVAPGATVTPMIMAARGGRDQAIDALASASPLGTALMPDEIAATLVFLASDAAQHITAQTVVVDSGICSAAVTARAQFHTTSPRFVGFKPARH